MDCSCDIDVYVDEFSEVLRETFQKARKEHKCGECYRTIVKGEEYEKIVTVFDSRLYTYKTCMDCVSVRKQFFTTFYYESIWEYFREYVSDVYGEIPENCISELTPAARAKVCELIEEQWGS